MIPHLFQELYRMNFELDEAFKGDSLKIKFIRREIKFIFESTNLLYFMLLLLADFINFF